MEFYIGTGLKNIEEHNKWRDLLLSEIPGSKILHDWTIRGNILSEPEEVIEMVAEQELDAVCMSDFVLIILPGGRGTHCELGMSLAMGNITFILSDNPNHFINSQESCAFYHVKDVVHLHKSTPMEENLKFIKERLGLE